ncbi:MAG TPA: cation:proton antiporter [Clostridia bacterium]|nr:cation:proton antiporter [Clostridia bacterium]
MNLLLKIGIVLLVGIIGGRVAKFFKLPNVTGYLIAGLFIGPSLFNLISPQDTASFSIINELALAAIAFSIGSEFLYKDMKKLGKNIIKITLSQVFGAVLMVFIVTFFIFKQSFVFSIVIASMSAATAPAATVMVIRQFKADGPLTRTILPVVALDDAFGIVLFSLAISVAKLSLGEADFSFLKMIGQPMWEIIGSLLLGLIIGFILTLVAKKAKDQEELLSVVLASIVLGTGLSNVLGMSPLLTCMMLGATLVNLKPNSQRVFSVVNNFIPPVYLLFFTLAGASLDLGVLSKVGFLGVGYILARAGGKILGSYLGAKAVNAHESVTKYLGFALLPQGGISIGLSMVVMKELPQFSSAIITVILFSVLVYEATGPIFAKIAIQKAEEVNGLEKAKKHRVPKESEVIAANINN